MSKDNKNRMKRISISFYKKRTCWYAEVPEHTESQNLMVSGADTMCEVLAQGHKRVTVEAVGHEGGINIDGSLLTLEKLEQSVYGATYAMYAPDAEGKRLPKGMPRECWLCNVTKTVFGGNHPRYIEVLSVEPNDEKPYIGNPLWERVRK